MNQWPPFFSINAPPTDECKCQVNAGECEWAACILATEET